MLMSFQSGQDLPAGDVKELGVGSRSAWKASWVPSWAPELTGCHLVGALLGPYSKGGIPYQPLQGVHLCFIILKALFGCSGSHQGRLSPEGVMSLGLLLRAFIFPLGVQSGGLCADPRTSRLYNVDNNLCVLAWALAWALWASAGCTLVLDHFFWLL